MSEIIFFLPLLRHESITERSQFLVNKTGYDQFEVISDLKNLAPVTNKIVVTDDISRLGESPKKVVSKILTLLERDNKLKIHNQLTFSKDDLNSLEIIKIIDQISTNIKSRRIKEALFVKKALSGTIHNSSPLTSEMVKRIKDEFDGGVRSTARKLGVSPASVSRVINNKR